MADSLKATIVGVRTTDTPKYGMTLAGYSCRSGAPTSQMVLLEGEKRWRRLMCWQFSIAGTLFVRIKGVEHIVTESHLPVEAWGTKQ